MCRGGVTVRMMFRNGICIVLWMTLFIYLFIVYLVLFVISTIYNIDYSFMLEEGSTKSSMSGGKVVSFCDSVLYFQDLF